MKSVKFILVLIVLKFGNVYGQVPKSLEVKLNYLYDSLCKKSRIKGVNGSIYIPYFGQWNRAWGVHSSTEKLDTNMLMGIGSNTKTYTTIIMLKMQEMGLLTINDTIGKWIKNVPNIPGNITIKQLLNHTSGLYSFTNHPSYFAEMSSDWGKMWALKEIYKFVDAPVAKPGGAWDYCNTNFTIAGDIIETVMKKPYQQVINELLLIPSKMNETFYYGANNPNLPLANQWSINIGGNMLLNMDENITGYSKNAMFTMAGTAGCMFSTASDNARFWSRLLRFNLLKTSSYKDFFQTVKIGTGVNYGLGVFRYRNAFNNRVIYSHGGTYIGYINENIVDSISGVSISLLTNQDSIGNDQLSFIIKSLHKCVLENHLLQNDIVKTEHINLFPNPSNTIINWNIGAENFANVVIKNFQGQIIFNTKLNANSMDISALKNGVYLVDIITETKKYSGKFVKQ